MKYIIGFIVLTLMCVAARSQNTSFVVRSGASGDTLFSCNPSTGICIQLTRLVPDMSGQSGKVLSTDGTNYNWINVQTSGSYVVTTNNLSDLANASTARTNLGLAIGTNVQAYDVDLTTYAGITPSVNVQSLLSSADYAAMRSNLSLVIGTNVQAYDADLTTYSGISPSANVQALLGSADYAAFKASLSLNNVTNESKATMFASPAFTGTPTGIGLPVYARVTGSNFTTTGQALTDITGLSVALTTNATYEVEVVLGVSTSAVTTGTQYGINYSVAGGAIEAGINGSLTSTATKTERITALNTATSAYLTTSAQTGQVIIKGIVTTGANAGNLTAKTLKVTSGTSTIFINSYIKVTRIN